MQFGPLIKTEGNLVYRLIDGKWELVGIMRSPEAAQEHARGIRKYLVEGEEPCQPEPT